MDFIKGKEDWFALYANDGKIDDYTFCNKVERGHFRLHPKGPNGLSEGCVTIEERSDFVIIRSMLLRSSMIDVPGSNMKAYGVLVVK